MVLCTSAWPAQQAANLGGGAPASSTQSTDAVDALLGGTMPSSSAPSSAATSAYATPVKQKPLVHVSPPKAKAAVVVQPADEDDLFGDEVSLPLPLPAPMVSHVLAFVNTDPDLFFQ